jgi:hypothetical protein
MTRNEMLTEIERLKSTEQSLWLRIKPLRAELYPLEQKRIDAMARRLDLERAIVEVKHLPYVGQKNKPKPKQLKQNSENEAISAFMELSSEEREKFLKALEGKLTAANG